MYIYLLHFKFPWDLMKLLALNEMMYFKDFFQMYTN